MKQVFFQIVFVAAALALAPWASLADDRQKDEAVIRDLLQARQQAAWNAHDAKAYAALFAENGDLVNVVEWWWRGRAEIENKCQAGAG